jgi:hypothetical protein
MYTRINEMKFKVKFIKDGHPVAPEGIQDDNIDEEDKAGGQHQGLPLMLPICTFLLLAIREMKMTG